MGKKEEERIVFLFLPQCQSSTRQSYRAGSRSNKEIPYSSSLRTRWANIHSRTNHRETQVQAIRGLIFIGCYP